MPLDPRDHQLGDVGASQHVLSGAGRQRQFPAHGPAADPHKFFKIIQMRSHLFTGLMDSTMSHGEAWNFARIGMMIERADKTSRILDVKYFMLLPQADLVNTPSTTSSGRRCSNPPAPLKCSARASPHHPRNGGQLFDFRRPVSALDPPLHRQGADLSAPHRRVAAGSANNTAEKRLGRLKADLEYTDIDEVIEHGMHEFLDSLQTRLNQIDGHRQHLLQPQAPDRGDHQ
jgi:hypothetical protein